VTQTLLAQELHQPGADVHVRAAEDRQPDDVGILLKRGGDDLLGRLTKTGVDNLHPRIAKGTRDHFGASIVAIKTGLGDYDTRFPHRHKTRLRETSFFTKRLPESVL
jgi:hypothetical protein